MGNKTSKGNEDLVVGTVVFRRSPKSRSRRGASCAQHASARPVSYAVTANGDAASRAHIRHRQGVQSQQLQCRPLSMQSVPSSTMHSDTRLVISQLCAKRPKYSLLKQIDLDQLDDQVQFLLFESACDLLDQLGTIERLKAEKRIAASAEGVDAKQIVSSYRQLANGFLSSVAPELLMLTSDRPEELYHRMHRALAGMLRRVAELRASRVDAALLELMSPLLPSANGDRLFDLSLRREVERLLDRTADQVVKAEAGHRGWGHQLLLSTGVQESEDTVLPLGAGAVADAGAHCTIDFLDAFAAWCWRAVCCSGLVCPTLRIESATAVAAAVVRFDPRLHATVLGPERPGAPVACVLWPTLSVGRGVEDVVLCKALVTLVL